MPVRLWFAILGSLSAVSAAPGDDAKHFDSTIRPFLAAHCGKCHAAGNAEGKFRLDSLPAGFADEAARRRWAVVAERVRSGEMPPEDEPRPPADKARDLLAWIGSGTRAAEDAHRATSGRVVARRLNRVEYENSLRDLLGVDVDVQDALPADGMGDGFDNNADALHVSSFLMEKYLEAADKAIDVAISNLPQPPVVRKRLDMKVERHVKVTTEKVFLHRDDSLVMFSSSPWQGVTLGQFYPPDRGRYRIRMHVSGHQSGGKPVVFRVDAGPMLMATKNHLVDYFDAPADKPATIEFRDHFEARTTIRILPYGLASAQAVNKVGADKWDGPGLAVHWVEVEGPLNDAWPPASHRKLFGDMAQGPAPAYNQRNRVEVTSKNPEVDAERILRTFARRAFRRTVSDEAIKPILTLVRAKLAEKYSFELAVRVGLAAILVSPDFLFLREKPGELDDFALAARLSYFLWSSTPDDELLALAEKGELRKPDVLRAQTERLLNSPKARAFTENFVGQWLGLRDIDFTVPSHILYPDYDEMLKVSMLREAHLFFEEVLKNDLSLTEFTASNFSMLNGRLARHYGIGGVDGWAFRKTALPPESKRGGVLTMAGVLKVTANGTSTSPVIRGAWVLDRLLGTPPPKPPEGVAAVEPDIRGATTIREQLVKHRNVPACNSCHAKIDPPGFALESFDVIGGYREFYRTSGRGQPVMIDGRRMPYLKGPKVDPSGVTADGAAFADIDGLKKLLLRDKDQLARAMVEKLVAYGTGAAPTSAADKAQVEAIIARIRGKSYGLRTLVHEIVQSPLVRSK